MLTTLLFLVTAARAGFYDVESVSTIELSFAEPNWDEILDSLYAQGNEERLVGTAVINGVRFDSVGVRYKGQSSYNPNRAKNPFNIKLDYVIEDQLIEGYGTLRLANVFKDPSFVREVLSYEIARNYMPAGKANYANIYVNGSLIGLYTSVQDVDKLFMRNHFCCDENARFKGRMEGPVPTQGWKYLGPDSSAYSGYYELQSDSGWAELVQFLDTLSNFTGAVEDVLNLDRHLWMLAFDILMVNLDAPINMPQNYYLYQDATGQFNPIIWDLNENFGAFRDLHGTGQLTVAQMQQLDPFLRSTDPEFPIASKFLSNFKYRRMYIAHMRTMIGEIFADGWYEDRALELQDIIDAHVRADPNKFYTYNDFLNNITRSAGSGPLAIVGLTQLMDPRVSFLLGRPEFQASAPEITAVFHAPETVFPNSDVLFSAEVEGADTVMLGYRQVPGTRFHKTRMYDDGQHGDGAAGDGAYAALVRIGCGDVHYYVYAENGEAAAFLPERAEHEFFTLPVAGEIVINELMALNETTVQDPSGEYDDWVELYNNSGAPVSLTGYHLTDDSLDLTKWTFPDAVIPASEYLIVWADEDMGQPGLHASFKLSGSGEILVMSDPAGTKIDRVVFGQQTADISLGRFPNGTGPFMLMSPTFGAENDSGVGAREETWETLVARFEPACPNPFRGTTTIRYTLAVPTEVSLRVYDAAGRTVAVLVQGRQDAGAYSAGFSAGPKAATPGGVYFAQLQARPVVTGAGGLAVENLKLILTR